MNHLMINIFLYSLVKLRIVLYSLVFKHYNKYNKWSIWSLINKDVQSELKLRIVQDGNSKQLIEKCFVN